MTEHQKKLVSEPILTVCNPSDRKWRPTRTKRMRRRRRRNVMCCLFVWQPYMYKHASQTTPLFPSAPKCGFIKGNEKVALLLERVKPEIVDFRETIISVSDIYVEMEMWKCSRFWFPRCFKLKLPILLKVSCWIQHLIPKIEDGNDFGVAIQVTFLWATCFHVCWLWGQNIED